MYITKDDFVNFTMNQSNSLRIADSQWKKVERCSRAINEPRRKKTCL